MQQNFWQVEKKSTYFKTIESNKNFKREVIDKTKPGFFWLKVSFSNQI